MRQLGQLQGRGAVEFEGKVLGLIDYRITIWRAADGLKSADGNVIGSPEVLGQVFNRGTAILRLQADGSVRFIVTELNGDGANIQISGPVPGF